MIVDFDFEHVPYRFEHPDGDHIGRMQAAARSFYELDLLTAIRGELRARPRTGGPREWALDVGAHVGNHAVYFAGVLGLRVLALEPNPEILPFLTKNAGQCSGITVLGVAVGGGPGDVRVQLPPRDLRSATVNTGMAHVDDIARGGPLAVCTRLQDAVALLPPGARIRVVKLDVEGWEDAIIAGSLALFRDQRPIVVAEAHNEERLAALDGQLGRLGYERDPRRFCKTPTYLWSPR